MNLLLNRLLVIGFVAALIYSIFLAGNKDYLGAIYWQGLSWFALYLGIK